MKQLISILTTAFCTCLLVSSCAKDEEVMTGTIIGLVSDYTNANTAIAGATVTINSKGLTKTTGSDGRFEFSDLEPGTYSIQVSANTYQTTTKQVTVYAGQSANCDFQLEKSSANVEISPMTLTFGQGVDQLSFSIKNNGNQSLYYSISDTPDYVEVSPASGTATSKSSQAITVRIKDRSSITTARNAQLKVNVGNDSYIVSLSVDAYTDTSADITIEPKALTFDNDTEVLTFTMTSGHTQELAYKIESDLDLLTVNPAEGKLAARGKVEVSVKVKDRKKVTEDQTGVLTITIGSNTYVVSVNVPKYDETVNVDIQPKTLTFDKDTERLSFKVTSKNNKDFTYNISSDLSPLTITPTIGTLSAQGSVEVSVSVKDRKAVTEDRTGTIRIVVGESTYTIQVKIDKYDEAVNADIQPMALTFDKDTERLNFKVISKNNIDFTYNISSDLSFLTITPTSGKLSANGSVEVTVSVKDRKTITTDRTGTININIGGTVYTVQVKVEKYDEAVNIDIQPTTLTFDKDTERLSFKITSKNTIDFAYSISSNLNFLTLSPANGTLSAQSSIEVSVSVKDRKNITIDQTGAITVNIGGNTYTIQVSVAKYEDNSQGGGGSDDGIAVPSGLYAYFTFEDNTKDLTDTGLSGTGIGTSYVTSYDGTKALNIPGNESAMFSVPNALVDQQEMTISFWVKDLYDGHIFHAVRGYDNKSAFLLSMENGRLKFVVTRYDIGYKYSSIPSFINGSLDGWHMITLVSDFNKTTYATITTRLYIDGIYADIITEDDNPFGEAEGGSSSRNYNACTKFIMGGSLSGSYEPTLNATRITIDNLRVYRNRRLSEQEIKTIYNSEKK